MYSKRVLKEMHDEIEQQIRAMPDIYTSLDFWSALETNHPQKYETLIRYYMDRGHDRPHAIQILNAQLMHTVNTCFIQLTRKVETIDNPKGGVMSRWIRL